MSHFTFPAVAAHTHAEAGQQLEALLAPLVAYCDRQRQNDNLSPAGFRHVVAVRQAIDAVLRYDEATEALLTECRVLLEQAQRLAESRVPSLNVVVLAQAVHYERALREKLARLYAQHAILPAAVHPPDSIWHRTQAHLASPQMQAYATLPLKTKLALNNLSPADLHAHVERRETQSQAD